MANGDRHQLLDGGGVRCGQVEQHGVAEGDGTGLLPALRSAVGANPEPVLRRADDLVAHLGGDLHD